MVDTLSGPEPLAAELETADRELLSFAIQLTQEPWAINSDSVQRLRAQGFDDRAIHDACQVVAYFAYVNRVADGLGVELERAE